MTSDRAENVRTILICDDNLLNRKLIAALLNGPDYCVLETESGRECLDIVRLGAPQIDLLLLDISLKDINGIEICRAIRAIEDAHLQQMPVFAYTARAMEEDCREYLECGFTDVLIKPIVRNDLIKLINKHLS